MNDTLNTLVDRFYTVFFHTLQANCPDIRNKQQHPYATGNTMANIMTLKKDDGWQIVINVPYADFEFGINQDGSKRTPRGPHEEYNFTILDKATEIATSMAKQFAASNNGGATNNGTTIY